MFGRKRVKPLEAKSLDDLKPLLAEGKPVLLDFWQPGCRNCKIMDGIVNELAEEYGGSAHVVKVDVTRVTGAAESFSVKATPTFVAAGPAGVAGRQEEGQAPRGPGPDGSAALRPVARWRASGWCARTR